MHGGTATGGVVEFNAGVVFDKQFSDVVRTGFTGHQQSRVVVRVTCVWISSGLQQHLCSIRASGTARIFVWGNRLYQLSYLCYASATKVCMSVRLSVPCS